MSHYKMLVCLSPSASWETSLDEALAPFDENLEVEEYREYESGEPSNHWSWEEEKVANPNPTWAEVANSWNAEYAEESPNERLYIDDTDGRAYTLSTNNPSAKWDWYEVGGRWSDCFRYKPEHDGARELIMGSRSWASEPGPSPAYSCDGGPIHMLDLDATLQADVDERLEAWAKFQDAIKGYPLPLTWKTFTDRMDTDGWTIEQARRAFSAQPAVAALKASGRDYQWDTAGYVDNYCKPKQDVIDEAMLRALPGRAMLDLEGNWHEAGDMGWFGMSSDTQDSLKEYQTEANKYIMSLSEDIVLVNVDIHI